MLAFQGWRGANLSQWFECSMEGLILQDPAPYSDYRKKPAKAAICR
jgi:hypothetical protein